ncbi:MAG: TRAP transporter large permease [Burkholderiales bacterium]|nr:TRAP transporter large permease [Burkholderiales bacterium]
MVSLVVFATLLGLMMLGMPIAIALALATATGMLWGGYDLILIPQNMVSSVKSIELTAIPFFILAAALMNQLGITRKIFDFAQALVGTLRGGLAHANVVAGFIFSGISGAAVADAAALAAISSKEMPKAGYSKEFAAATVLAVSTLGPIIPPSIMMVVYAITANVSIARLFVAGIGPGILIAALLMLLIVVLTRYGCTPSPPPGKFSARKLGRTTKDALLALFAPLVIMRGMVSGWATPTEAGVLAVAYALFVGAVQRNLTFAAVSRSLVETVEASALILYVIAISSGLSYVFVAEGTAAHLTSLMTSLSIGPVSFLLLSNLLLLMLGCLIETLPAMLLAVPLLLPTALAVGVDPTHFGVLVIFNLLIGYMHPPMGIGLFILMAIARVEFVALVKATLPFIGVLLLALALLTFVPSISLWLPDLVLPQPGK